MRKLLESMDTFAGEPEQKPGDQVRGTEKATKKKSGQHPFQGRLVGGESIFRELERQLVEGNVERRLREEFEQFANKDVTEANDPNFVGFMNKTLGDRVDAKPEQPKTGHDWYDNAPMHDMNTMPSYKPAFKFGMTVIQSMDKETKKHFAEADEDVLFSYLMKLARKKGLSPKYFVEEDLFEVTGLFSEIFHDPAMTDWSWADLLRNTLKDQDPEEQLDELGANNPPQQNSAVAATTAPGQPPTQPGQPAAIDPKETQALKQNLAKLKTSIPGLDITKATSAMAKADTGTQLNPADQKVASTFAPELANVMKNPQMANSLKMMIDKANQQEKAAASKPPGTI